MSRYLSPEWFAEVSAAQGPPPEHPDLVLRQVVTGAPWGDVTYQVLVGEGCTHLRQVPGDAADDPGHAGDVELATDFATASAIGSGQLSVEAALSAGRIRVSGDTNRLVATQALFVGIDPLPAVVRAKTSWDDGPGASSGGRDYGGTARGADAASAG